MRVKEIAQERLPEFLHHYRRALDVLRKTNESDSREEMANSDKDGIVAIAYLRLIGPDPTKHDPPKPRRYFAEPGEAEWGC